MIVILQFLGTNCENDLIYTYENILRKQTCIIWHKDKALPYDTSLVIIPGGFSYGDYLRCGAIAKLSSIMKDVIRYSNNGGYILGICNGFQILTESHLLPGALIRNNNLVFKSSYEELEIISNNNKLLKNYNKNQIINLPIAHADGRFYIEKEELEDLINNDQILLKYKNNINGSIDSIAGICNKDKNIFGMMPHPERAIETILGSEDGLMMLKDICE